MVDTTEEQTDKTGERKVIRNGLKNLGTGDKGGEPKRENCCVLVSRRTQRNGLKMFYPSWAKTPVNILTRYRYTRMYIGRTIIPNKNRTRTAPTFWL